MILGIDWLTTYKAQMDYFVKPMILQGLDGWRVKFRGKRNVIPNCIISAITAKRLMRKRCNRGQTS
jgi:hypothetical protein